MNNVIQYDDWERQARECPYDDDGDDYTATLYSLQQQALRLAEHINPKQRLAIEQFVAGQPSSDIAEDLGYSSPGYIKKLVFKTPTTVAYMNALYRLQRHQQGPTTEQRSAMLWRIARAAEEDDPRTAIVSVDIMNKMAGLYQEQTAKHTSQNSATPVNITIQNYAPSE